MRFLAAIAIAAAALALTATVSTAAPARQAPHQLLGMIPHLAHHSNAPLTQVRRAAKGAPLNCVSACTAYESTINQYFTDVQAASVVKATDNVYSVATQYSDIQYSETFAGAYADGNPYPTTHACHDGVDTYCVTDGQLQAQIGSVIAANHLPRYSTSALYFIFTPANVGVCQSPGRASGGYPCTTNVFCAYHSASQNGFIYAVEPDAAAVPGDAAVPHPCDPGQAPAGSNADATINTISHEQNESITDPFGNAWIADDGPGESPQDEIGDLCAYDFGTPSGTPGTEYDQTINGHNYLLQLEYSNQDSGCVPYLGGPVTPANPRYGMGPLVDQSPEGTVMITNTVYAIYWLPAAPANTKLPTISGTTDVGKKLKASNGTWSNGPTFTYRWLRCSSAGLSCKGITKATGASYTLVKADKGHRLEVRVTGTNMISAVSATSAPTGVVK